MRATSLKYLVSSLTLGAVIALANAPARAFFGGSEIVYDPTLTGKVIAAEARSAADAMRQIQVELNQYQMMIQNTLALGDPVFKPLGDTLRSLYSVYSQGQSLMYRAQNLDSMFGYMYPSYQSYLWSMGQGTSTFGNKYQAWSERNYESVRTALKSSGMQVNAMESEEAMMQRLILRSSTADGQVKAIQAGNEIAAEQVRQLQNMRLLIDAQIKMHADFMSNQYERETIDNATRAQWRSAKPVNSPGRGF